MRQTTDLDDLSPIVSQRDFTILPKDGRKWVFDMSPVLIRKAKAIKEHSNAAHTSVMEPWQAVDMILCGEPENEKNVHCDQSHQFLLPLLLQTEVRKGHRENRAHTKDAFPPGVLDDWASAWFLVSFVWDATSICCGSHRDWWWDSAIHWKVTTEPKKMTAARMFKERRKPLGGENHPATSLQRDEQWRLGLFLLCHHAPSCLRLLAPSVGH